MGGRGEGREGVENFHKFLGPGPYVADAHRHMHIQAQDSDDRNASSSKHCLLLTFYTVSGKNAP